MSKGLQYAKEILGKYNLQMATAPNDPRTSHHLPKPFDLDRLQKSPHEYLLHQAQPPPTTTSEFDGMIWTKKHAAMMPPTNEQHNPEDSTGASMPPTTWWEAMPRQCTNKLQVHNRVATKVPSLGATIISLYDQKVHNQVASNDPNLRAAISLNGCTAHNRVANDNASLSVAITPDCTHSDGPTHPCCT